MSKQSKSDKEQKTKTKNLSIINEKEQELISETDQIISQYTDEYNQFMDDFQQLNFQQDYGADLKKYKIQYHPKIFTEKILIQIISQKREGRIVQLKVRLSYFTFFLTVYSHDHISKTYENLEELGQGAFATVFKYQDEKKLFAIKSFKYGTKFSQIRGNIVKMIQEYCIYKVASLLKIGPLITYELGFDLIVYEDCIQFCLELCQSPEPGHGQELKEELKLLHYFKIIHGDIKEENIMFSQAFNKNVFIDFNCSSVIKEKIGFKTLTSFKGTLENTLPQFQNLFLLQSTAYIDLYYNDVYALKKVKIGKYNKKKGDEQYIADISTYSYICFCHHLNLRQNYFQLRSSFVQQFISKNFQQLNIPKYLKQKSFQQNGRNLYLLLIQEIISIINDTVELCYEFSLNSDVLKKNKIIMKYFESEIGFNEKKKQTFQMRYKRLMKFKWHQKQVIVQNIASQSFELLQILLPQIFLQQKLSHKIYLFQKMKQLDHKDQKQFIKIYEQLIQDYCEQYIIKKAIKLFESRGYLKFLNSDLFIDKMLKIDKHYNIGKYKNRFKLKQNNCEKSRFGIYSLFRIEDLINKLNNTNFFTEKREVIQYIYKKLREIFELNYQNWFSHIQQCQLHLKKILNKSFANSQFQFIIQFLRFIACCYNMSSDGFQNVQKYKISSLDYIRQFADKHRLSSKFYMFIQQSSLLKLQQIYNSKSIQILDEWISQNQFYEYQLFAQISFRKIYLNLMFGLQTKKDINDLFRYLSQCYPCEHCFIMYLSRLLTVVRQISFQKQMISKAQKYFCEISLAQSNPQMHSAIQQLNESFMLQMSTMQHKVYYQKYEKWLQSEYPNKNYPLNSIKVRLLFLQEINQLQQCQEIIKKQLNKYLNKIYYNREEINKLIWILYIYWSIIYLQSQQNQRMLECDQIISIYFSHLQFSLEIIYGDTQWMVGAYLLWINDFKKLIYFWNQISMKCNQQNKNLFSAIFFFQIRKIIRSYMLDKSYITLYQQIFGWIQQFKQSLFNNPGQYSSNFTCLLILITNIVFFGTNQIKAPKRLQLFQFIQKVFTFIFKKTQQMTQWLYRRIQENIMIIFMHRLLIKEQLENLQTNQDSMLHLQILFGNSNYLINCFEHKIIPATLKSSKKIRYVRRLLHKQSIEPYNWNFRAKLNKILLKHKIKNKIIKQFVDGKLSRYFNNKQQIFECRSHTIQPTIRRQYEQYLN